MSFAPLPLLAPVVAAVVTPSVNWTSVYGFMELSNLSTESGALHAPGLLALVPAALRLLSATVRCLAMNPMACMP